MNAPGVTANTNTEVHGPASNTDSVDADDGSIDGSGIGGHSFFSSSGSTGITFTFDAGTLGALPTVTGIVWTDGAGTTSFEAFGAAGQSLGTIGPATIADSVFIGGTNDDHFFGWTDAGGISKINISNTSGGIEVDHLQYGSRNVPEPAILSLFGAGLVTLVWARRRRKAA